jgi:GT2 family glycosyltransferase/glycosyltransferase involved in cell wall biosynthesis/2-polyprenyl-3-methyl-5-hydroxy-6-metoxy-1,4-benzoquinol methylase
LLDLVRPGTRVLDVGCATGRFAAALRQRDCRVTGVEFDAEAASAARERCDEVLEGDIGQLLVSGAFEGRVFDVVIAADVLEHLVDPWSVVRGLRTLLAPGGVVLASIPNVTHASVILEMCAGRFPLRPEGLLDMTHLRFFGEESALSLFTDNGYAAQVVARVRHDPRHTEFATRLETVPEAILEFLDENPNADTYQFIIRAWRDDEEDRGSAAVPEAPSEALHRGPIRNALMRELEDLHEQVARYHEAAIRGDGEQASLRDTVARYHHAAVAREAEFAKLSEQVTRYHEAAIEREATLASLTDQVRGQQESAAKWEREALELTGRLDQTAARLDAVEARSRVLEKRVAHARRVVGAVADRRALRVLYVTDGWDGPFRFRCRHAVEQLRQDGVPANVMALDDPVLLSSLLSYSIVVLFRLPWNDRVEAIIEAVRRHGATLVFESDDLIFDPTVEPLLGFLSELPRHSQREYRERLQGLHRTFMACDLFIGSTPTLVRHAEGLGKPAVLHPNLINPLYERLARVVRPLRRLRRPPPTIAYVSGSNTHDRDLAMVAAPLAAILREERSVRLLLCGFVTLPGELEPYAAQIVRVPYQDWRVYPWALGLSAVSIAPVSVINDFAHGKSALKFFEAGVFGVPSVGSPTESFLEAITHGTDGFLATDAAEWETAIRASLDPIRGAAIGERARRRVLEHYTFSAHRGRLERLLRPWIGQAPGPEPEALPVDPERRGHTPTETRGLLDRVSRVASFVRGRPVREPVSVTGAAFATPLEPAPFEGFIDTLAERGAAWASEEHQAILAVAADATDWSRWTPRQETAVSSCDASSIRLESPSNDPGLISPPLELEAARFRYLVIRMRSAPDAPGCRAQLFWSADGAFSEAQSVIWPLEAGVSRRLVLDLEATAWAEAGTVTRLRLDPLDRPGSVELGELLLLGDLAQLEGGDVRSSLAARHIHGHGIECGALQKRLPVPGDAQVLYVDRLTETQARAHYAELQGQPLVVPGVVAELNQLPFAAGTLDFCIGNHLLEHDRDPIAGLQEMLRVVRPGGIVYVSVPDVGNPLDRHRPVTAFSHLVDDHDPTRDRRPHDIEHYREYVASAHHTFDAASRTDLVNRYVKQAYSVHFHTFDESSFRTLLQHVGRIAGARVIEFVRNPTDGFDEYVAVLRRIEDAGAVRRAQEGALAPRHSVDIVVPIYNARREVVACVESVLEHARGDWRLVLVDDASTDPELRAFLDRLAATEARVSLLRNAENVGFVKSANRGFANAEDRDVVLLNSDTIVTHGFLEGLMAAAYHAGKPGIVSPLSNNATICSVPRFCEANDLPEGETVDSFGMLIARNSLRLHPELVSAHGFCMYVPMAVRRAIGIFDEERFGRGFGEENDYAERAMAAGFRIRLADDVFVYHAESASFGDHAAETLRNEHYAVLRQRHPTYFPRVGRFCEENPLLPVHKSIDLALRHRSHDTPALLYLLHASFEEPGGGTEHHVRDLVRVCKVPRAIVAVPSGDVIEVTEVLAGRLDEAIRYRFPVHRPTRRFVMQSEDLAQAVRCLVRVFGVGAVHIQHLAGWPITISRTIRELGLSWAYSVHDFYCICPNVNLFDGARQQLCCAGDDVTEAERAACLRSQYAQYGEPVPADTAGLLREHRAEFQHLLAGATRICFPSQRARDVVAKYFDLSTMRAQVIPHGYDVPHGVPSDGLMGAPLRLALLGAVAHPIKGADSYRALVARTKDLPVEWHIFGDVLHLGFGDALRVAGSTPQLHFHGEYMRANVVERLAEAGIGCVVLLSPWPETFSYTLSEALCAGVPAIVSNQGALAERVRESGAGVVVDSVEEAAATIERFVHNPAELEALRVAARRYRHPSIDDMARAYQDVYREMLGPQPPPAALGLYDRRRLVEAHLLVSGRSLHSAARRPTWLSPPLPHYGRYWYRYYHRVAPLLPRRVRGWAREQVAARRWRPIVRYRLGDGNGSVAHTSGLEQMPHARLGGAFRAVNEDPWFVFTSQPFRTADVRVIRFRMRRRAQDGEFAQLFWAHETGECFSEEKSLRIPLEVNQDGWREYVVWLDRSERAAQWNGGQVIHHLRFDPLNVPGEFQLEELLLCAWDSNGDSREGASA